MSLPTQTRVWTLDNPPTGNLVLSGPSSTFKLDTVPLPEVPEDSALVQVLFFSNDPAQRTWIDSGIPEDRLYVPPVRRGEPMRAIALAKVLRSTSSKFKTGDFVTGIMTWAEYSVQPASQLIPAPPLPNGLSLTHHLGAYGLTGLTAYYGLLEIGEIKASDSIVVSGAAGATGSMAVQIAKHMVGCKKVVGIAGTDEKCRWVESLGADVCINYKAPDFEEQLVKATTPFVDVYYDNVGGNILDLMLGRLAMFGRVIACGAASRYNDRSGATTLMNYLQIILQRLSIKGFILLDHWDKYEETVSTLIRATEEGKIKVGDRNETVVQATFEEVPGVLVKLFDGSNTGKLVTQLIG